MTEPLTEEYLADERLAEMGRACRTCGHLREAHGRDVVPLCAVCGCAGFEPDHESLLLIGEIERLREALDEAERWRSESEARAEAAGNAATAARTALADLTAALRNPGGGLVEVGAVAAHDAYEAAAVRHGWETNELSRVPWDSVPDENKATTRAGVAAAIAAVAEHLLGGTDE